METIKLTNGLLQQNRASIQVLLVEDNPEEALLVKAMLSLPGHFSFVIKHASSLEQALEFLPSSHPNIILSDLTLPDSHGYNTFHNLTQAAPNLPIILLTNLDDDELALQAIREGAQDYLVKTELSGSLLARSICYAIERKQIEEQLQFNALHDALTGLPNRVLLLDRINQALGHARRRQEYRFATLFLDLDRFKLINDSLGRSVGDQLLIACARQMESHLRTIDTIARLNSDEFVVLLEDVQRKQDILSLVERIQQALLTPFELNNQRVVVSASIGIVENAWQYDAAEEILRDADIAMQQAKLGGRNCIVLFEAGMRQRVILRQKLESELRLAMERQELQIYYQPIVSLKDWKISGFEALLRWKHDQYGDIPPKEFIPIAEETGLIHPLGLWVLRQACWQIAEWQRLFPIQPPLMIHVNISGCQIGAPNFVDQVEKILKDTHLEPGRLNLEITESLFVENNDRFNDTLARLHDLGIQLQIDDFGTGYSSFAYLQRIPVSTIKIDPTFINYMPKGKNHAEIVRSIVSLAHGLGLKAIAEGVETEAQVSQLQELECSYGQGFYISRPASAPLNMVLLRNTHGTGRLRTNPPIH